MDRIWRYGLVAGLLLSLASVVVDGVVGEVAYLAVGALCVAGVLLAVTTRLVRRPLPWLLLAAGLAFFVAGDALWTWYDFVLGTDPFPSPADALYLAGYPLLSAGLAVLIRRRTGGALHRASLLDAAVLTTGVGLVTWVFIVVPTAAAGVTALETTIATAYPVFDVVLLSLSIRLVLTPGGRAASFRLLAASMFLTLAADVGYAMTELYALPGSIVFDTLYLFGYLALAVGALHPSVRGVDGEGRAPLLALTRGRLVLLAGASLLAPAVQLASDAVGFRDHQTVIAVASAALFLLVVLRLSGLAQHVQAQTRELESLVRTDPLTGAGNRRGLAERLASLARPGETISVVVLDLDHFKDFNDGFGHPAGDALLQESVQAWRGHLRGRDYLARWGGEEFVAVLDRCAATEAVIATERLRAATPSGITCSAGVAVWDGVEDTEKLLWRADAALYRAKAEGRNRTVVADAPLCASQPTAAPVR